MGTMFYGAARTPVVIEDVTLLLLKSLIGNKFRRREGFLLSWDDPGGGRNCIWLHSESDLHFQFVTTAREPLDREVLEAMSVAAAGSGVELGDATRPWNWDTQRRALVSGSA